MRFQSNITRYLIKLFLISRTILVHHIQLNVMWKRAVSKYIPLKFKLLGKERELQIFIKLFQEFSIGIVSTLYKINH